MGFRPFVFRLARGLGLGGWVRNDGGGVVVEIEGPAESLKAFTRGLKDRLPPLARIDASREIETEPMGEALFSVVESDARGARTAAVPPDVATCSACKDDIFDPANRRYRYPFTNCTDCGPRFSIIEALPYDRAATAMRDFTMCERCRAEYEDPLDRRFHAEPNACPDCGPALELWDGTGEVVSRSDDALLEACELIAGGRIVALKGLGGFQLLADAGNHEVVERLRRRKNRPAKPFAVMCPSAEIARSLCRVGPIEAALLVSESSPIVLMPRLGDDLTISAAVAPHNPYLGVMLPYTPLHHILMHELGFPIVATSGNISAEPICIDNQEALERLGLVADFLLLHDRRIVRQMDDSVVQVFDGAATLLRSGRGYAPASFDFDHGAAPMLALGGHLKGALAVNVGGRAVLGQHIGDLDSLPAARAFEREAASIQRLHGLRLETVAMDAHPDYFTTSYARSTGLQAKKVQHHLAHVLSCMMENQVATPFLGVAWDGAGLGTDGTIWGGELILVGAEGWRRVCHLRRFRLPGGDAAVSDPRRCALGVLYEIYGDGLESREDLLGRLSLRRSERRTLLAMLRESFNCPVTSSAGRLFDAAAALTGVCERTSFEGEPAMRLQFAAERSRTGAAYRATLNQAEGALVIDWAPLMEGILADLGSAVPAEAIALKFHRALARSIAGACGRLEAGRVLLSGGCFQNRLLSELTSAALEEGKMEVYVHHLVPPNDGGLALGQLAAAALDLGEED